MAWPHVEKVPHPTPFSTWHYQASPVSSENPKQPETFPNSQGKNSRCDLAEHDERCAEQGE